MYQFDFVKYGDGDEPDKVISIFARDYNSAIDKIRKLAIPWFRLQDFSLEAVYEHGTAKMIMN